MSYIEVKNMSKTFKVAKRNSGIRAALKSFIKREYKYVEAVKDISFSINKGEIIGYIGPNGAGKSTTIKILSGILIPDSGECLVNGQIPWKDRLNYVSKIGVVFGQRSQLIWDIPALDTFDLMKDTYNIEKNKFDQNKSELIKLLEIEEIVKVPVRQLSLGQRMRCEIVASLLHSPDILFLDEPTIGLDAVSKEVVRNFIKKINKERNVTIILTTHDMSDIEALAKRVILIGKGKILYDDNLLKLKKEFSNKYINITTKSIIEKINLKGILSQFKTDNGYEFVIDTKIMNVSELLNYLSKKIDIQDIEIENESIDNIIINLYKEFNI